MRRGRATAPEPRAGAALASRPEHLGRRRGLSMPTECRLLHLSRCTLAADPETTNGSRSRILQVPQTGRNNRCSGPAEAPPAEIELMQLGRGTRRSHVETSTGTIPEMPWLKMREIAGNKAFSAYHQRSNLEDAPPNPQPSATPEGATQRSTNLRGRMPRRTPRAPRTRALLRRRPQRWHRAPRPPGAGAWRSRRRPPPRGRCRGGPPGGTRRL